MCNRFMATLACATIVAACAGSEPSSSPATAEDAAEAALLAWFAALGEGRYEDAIPLYGGSYEVLEGWNPDIDPADRRALWENACRFNGLVCLPRAEVLRVERTAGDTVHFAVRVFNRDGTVFVQGPCCGETEESMPSTREFHFAVATTPTPGVVTLPIYVP